MNTKRIVFLILILLVLFSGCIYNCHAEEKNNASSVWNAYYTTVKYYNPSLSQNEVADIVSNVIYRSYQHRLDPRFVMAVIAIESTFNPKAISPAGAMGLGQIMPENLKAHGVTRPFTPNENIALMVRLLKLNYDRFGHLPYKQRVHNTLAAYNAGYGAVIKYNGIPPYKETQNYVKKVIVLWRKFCGLK
ncbi:MAG: lytic transglycosylase domain-containing protein [Armatimonadota bacterium]